MREETERKMVKVRDREKWWEREREKWWEGGREREEKVGQNQFFKSDKRAKNEPHNN